MRTKINPAKISRGTPKIQNLLGLIGEVVSFSKIYAGPTGRINRGTYYVAIIKIPSLSKNYTVEICHENEKKMEFGAKVQLVVRKAYVSNDGLLQYIIKGKVI